MQMMCSASLFSYFHKKCVLCFFFNYHRKKITILNVNENCLNELLRNRITPHIAWGIILLPFFSFYSGSSSSNFVSCSFFSSLPCIREVINFCNFLDFKESFIVFLFILQHKFPAIASSSVFSFSCPFSLFFFFFFVAFVKFDFGWDQFSSQIFLIIWWRLFLFSGPAIL